MFCSNCGQSLAEATGNICPHCGTFRATQQNQSSDTQSVDTSRGYTPPGHDAQPHEGYQPPQPHGGYQPPQPHGGYPGHGGHPGHGAPGHGHHGYRPPPAHGGYPGYGGYPPASQPGRTKAIVALVLGILAMTIPIPVIDVILGVVGLVLADSSKRDGFTGGLRSAAFVMSVIGTIVAALYTISVLTGSMLWW